MDKKRVITVIGIGPGSREMAVGMACESLACAELIIGAGRVIDACIDICRSKKNAEGAEKKDVFISYKTDEIVNYIEKHKEYNQICVAFSGDIGFYSGAKGLEELLFCKGLNNQYEVKYIPGISAPIYFLDKLNYPWEDTVLISNHGRRTNIIAAIRDNAKVCTLLGSKKDVSDICEKLVYYGLLGVRVYVGERLSYTDERITADMASDMIGKTFDKLSVALFINEDPRKRGLNFSFRDEDFVRGSVPMTKQEVRNISIAKLCLSEASVVYDIGAGTGSVSVHAALLAENGRVYAIEKNPEGVELIEQNKRKHAVDNLQIIKGEATEVIGELETPTHAFIGGSGGNLKKIISQLLEKNPNIRCVINAVTIETLAALEEICRTIAECRDMEIIMINVSKGKKLGSYHLMSAENPVYIAYFGGKEE